MILNKIDFIYILMLFSILILFIISISKMKYTINHKMKTCTYYKLIKNIFKQLKKTPSDLPEYKIFIDGEFDSSQTKFEKLSNYAEIGVLANSNQVGYVLLLLLRILIDKNFDLIIYIFEDKDNTKLNMKSILKVLEQYETNYTEIFDLDKTIIRELTGNVIISKSLDEIDVWTLARVKKELLNSLEKN
jgi:hypothetical protein